MSWSFTGLRRWKCLETHFLIGLDINGQHFSSKLHCSQTGLYKINSLIYAQWRDTFGLSGGRRFSQGVILQTSKATVNWGKQISKIDYLQTKNFSTWPVCALDRWRFGSYGGKVSSLRHHQESWKMFFIVILLNLDFLIFLVQFWLPPGYWWGDLEGFCFVGKVR